MFSINQSSRFKLESLSIPTCCATISASILVFHATFVSSRVRELTRRLCAVSTTEEHTEPIQTSKTRDIFGIARLCGCVTLIGLAFSSIEHENTDFTASAMSFQFVVIYVCFSFLLHGPQCDSITQVYASILAFISIVARSWSTIATRHLNALFSVIFFTYVYRDLFPLATFNQPQRDINEGWLLWAKFSIITAIGVIIPLSVPRRASLNKVGIFIPVLFNT